MVLNAGQAYKLCWKCKHRLKCSSIFCADGAKNGDSCGIIQPVHERAIYTEVFFPDRAQLPVGRQYKVERDNLRKVYINLQGKVHPDRWSAKSSELGRIAEEQSSFVNRGFYILKDPLRRARYLLSLEGIEIKEGKIHDDKFLEHIFELSTGLHLDSEEERRLAYKGALELNDDLIKALEDSFAAEDLEAAKKCTEMLQYVKRVIEAGKEMGIDR